MIDVFLNQQRTGYEEVFSYGPYFYVNVKEMDANYQFAGYTLDTMADKLKVLINDQFIDYADEATILRLENWLGIDLDTSKSLADRRKKVKLLWNGGEKLSATLIKSLVKSYTGCAEDPVVKFTTTLSITARITEDHIVYFNDLIAQLEKMKPAHIKFSVTLDVAHNVTVGNVISHTVFEYPVTGVRPDIATLGDSMLTTINVINPFESAVFGIVQASEQSVHDV